MAEPSGPRASVWTRFGGLLIDGLIVGIPTALIGAILGLEPIGSQSLSIVVGLVYFGVLEGMPAGQTLGKRVMGIRVIDAETGGPILTRSWLRSIVRVISGYLCGLGFFWAIWDPENQTWHDKAAGCYVVPVADYPIT